MEIRRNFSFWPSEKSMLKRIYCWLVDRWLIRKYRLPDYFFDLTQCLQEKKLERVVELATSKNLELMTHPVFRTEADYLMSDKFQVVLQRLDIGGYALV
jgi:hypothetical protein